LINRNLKEEDAKVTCVPEMGNHLILDFLGMDQDINDYEFLDKSIREILLHAQVTVEEGIFKKFEP
jgi:hypothetical protein